MKVDLSQLFPQNRAEGVNGTGASHRSYSKDQTSPADEVRLSTNGSDIQTLKSKLQALPEIRSERVASLRQAIQSGSYKLDDRQIADAIYREYSSTAPASKPQAK